MKVQNKIEMLQIRLQGEYLGLNLELQQMTDILSKAIEEREFYEESRMLEIEKIIKAEGGSFDEDVINDVINEIEIMEEGITELLGLNAKCLTLNEVLDLNAKIKVYREKKINADTFDEIIEELENQDDNVDKKIFVYDTMLREYNELKYDEKYYFLLSKLNIVENNGSLLYLKDGLHTYDDLLHFLFDKDFTCIITRKNDDFYDIREENLEFTEFGKEFEEMKKEVDTAKKSMDEIKVMNSEEVSETLRAMVNEKAKEVEELLSESEKILGKSIEELVEEHDVEVDGDDIDDK